MVHVASLKSLVGPIMLVGILLLALRQILGPSYVWIVPMILLGSYVQTFPGDPVAQSLFSVAMSIGVPFFMLWLMYRFLLGPRANRRNDQ